MIRVTGFLLLMFWGNLPHGLAQQIVDLQCDNRVTSLAVDRREPLLSWRLEGPRDGLSQRPWLTSSLNGSPPQMKQVVQRCLRGVTKLFGR